MSFLARLVSDNYRSLEKFELGALYVLSRHPEEKFLDCVLVHGYLRVRFDLPSSVNLEI